MAEHNDLGRWGEEMAARHLEGEGWYIRHRDWRYGHRDIDIVAIDGDMTTLLIVEVKTRAPSTPCAPDKAVTLEKKNNIIGAAAAYVRMFNLHHLCVRYDTISIVGTPDAEYTIEHKENAFDVVANYNFNDSQRRKARYRKRPGCW